MTPRRATALPVRRVRGDHAAEWDDDPVAVEEPLEIRVEGEPYAVTMRTPGEDRELAAGFLLAEGVVDGLDDLVAIAPIDDPSDPRGNTIDVRLAPGVPLLRRVAAARQRFVSSACGVCGKEAIDDIFRRIPAERARWTAPTGQLHGLPEALRAAQGAFAHTGGTHAAALVRPDGELEVSFEDVGRHNAVDKVIGWRLLQDRLPVDDRLLLVSGRAGFEIVQKAAVAGLPGLAAVGAPSSLAVELAQRAGMLLIGFLRNGSCNVYSGSLSD